MSSMNWAQWNEFCSDIAAPWSWYRGAPKPCPRSGGALAQDIGDRPENENGLHWNSRWVVYVCLKAPQTGAYAGKCPAFETHRSTRCANLQCELVEIDNPPQVVPTPTSEWYRAEWAQFPFDDSVGIKAHYCYMVPDTGAYKGRCTHGATQGGVRCGDGLRSYKCPLNTYTHYAHLDDPHTMW